jgi:Ca2+-binding RTX toxin-like protein
MVAMSTIISIAGSVTLYNSKDYNSELIDDRNQNLIAQPELAGLIRGTRGGERLDGTPDDDVINSDIGSDTLYGGAGDDVLLAFGNGFDQLFGDEGDDYLYGGDAGNLMHGGSGNDYVFGGLMADKLNGDSGNDFLSGNGGNDKLSGGFGDDTLVGGAGVDELVGGWGADVFRFTSLDGIDTVSDFNYIPEVGAQVSQGDKFELSLSVFDTLGWNTGGTLSEEEFGLGSEATTASQRILYDKETGILSYDRDGNGAAKAIAFARVAGHVDLHASDFLINL